MGWGAINEYKRVCASEQFKYVSKYQHRNGNIKFAAYVQFKNHSMSKFYDSEKEAAKAVDVFLIKNGREPVNILVKK